MAAELIDSGKAGIKLKELICGIRAGLTGRSGCGHLHPMYKIIGADQKEYGPITADQLRQWISEGRVNANTKVQAEGAGVWKSVSELPEFAAALPAGAPSVTGLPSTSPWPPPRRSPTRWRSGR